jgi:hypothetical protein
MPEQTEVSNLPGTADVRDVTARVRSVAAGLTALLGEAETARRERAEATAPAGQSGAAPPDGDGGTAVCAWNHFENIPTFYNWNNRPR